MADQSDVETVLATQVTDLLYPQGSNAPSLLGPLTRIFRGWPNQATLNTDLAAGRVTVTIFPDPSGFQVTTRFIDPPRAGPPAYPNLSAQVAGNVATFSGAADPGQLAGLLIDNTAYVHRTATGDTPELVAAVLASYVRTTRIALLAGASVTIPGAGLVIARVVADQPVLTETRRQQQAFRLSCWCPNPSLRDAVATLIDQGLSAQTFLPMPDGTSARLRLAGTTVFDQSQNAGLYRRDLLVTAEYPTTLVTMLPAVIFGSTSVSPNGVTAQTLLG